MASMKKPSSRLASLVPLFLLLLAVLICYIVAPSASQPKTDLIGSVAKADRLPSWLRSKAIDKLDATNSTSGEIDDALKAVQKWASRSAQNKSGSLVVDVITIGSTKRMDHMLTQQRTWASNKKSVRNVFMATEINTDQAIISSGGSCKDLVSACGESLGGDEDLCLQRRIGLAVGASVRRYRKIIHSLVLMNSGSNVEHSNIDDSRDVWKKNAMDTLPNYLIITFDSAYYDTESLGKCMGHGEDGSPSVYAPFVSWTDVNLSVDKGDEKHSKSSFAYVTGNTGVVFNRAALEAWVRRIACFSSKDDKSSPVPINYDPKSQQVEHDWCAWMNEMTKSVAKDSPQADVFGTVISKTLKVSLTTQRNETLNSQDEFIYSSRLQAVSISDIFSIYSTTMHLLCKDNTKIKRIPSVEQMLGYLVHRFQVSHDGISTGTPDSKQWCKAMTSERCSPNSTVACANLTLQQLKDTI